MSDKTPLTQIALRASEFKPGFTFELKTAIEPETWERICIHQNCGDELIQDMKQTFRLQPDFFRRIR